MCSPTQILRSLQDFIALRLEVREVKKALAVKLVYQGYLYDEIQTIARRVERFHEVLIYSYLLRD